MLSHRNRKLVVAYPGEFKRQSSFAVAMDPADIDTRHPQTTPTYPGRQFTREQIRDCSGEYIIREDITSRLSRLRFSFDADAYLIAGWLAFAQGAAAAPAGTRANEVQRITPGGTIDGGSYNVSFEFEGIEDNVDIPFDATAAEAQALLEEIRSIKAGNVSVAGDLTTQVDITFQGRLAGYNVPALVVDDSNLTGAGAEAVLSTTTPGTSKIHNITRTTNDQPPALSLVVGFEGDTTPPDLYKSVVVNSITARGEVRGKVSVEIEVFASADTAAQIGYSMPACVNINPIYTRDCRVQIDGDFVAADIRDFTYTYSNNIFTGDNAFPYDDIEVERLEHGDRTSTFNFTIYGSKGDPIYNKAEAESIVPVFLYLGAPSNRVVIDAPKTSLKLSDDVITFTGEANKSAMVLNGTPFYDSATAGTPDRAFYYGNESTTFLAT